MGELASHLEPMVEGRQLVPTATLLLTNRGKYPPVFPRHPSPFFLPLPIPIQPGDPYQAWLLSFPLRAGCGGFTFVPDGFTQVPSSGVVPVDVILGLLLKCYPSAKIPINPPWDVTAPKILPSTHLSFSTLGRAPQP